MNFKFACVKEDSGVKICLYDSINQINQEDWNSCNVSQNIYLGIPYLSAIEQTMANDMEFRYIQFYSEQDKAIGAAVIQVITVEDSFENHEDVFCKVKATVKQKLLNTINAKVLVCGNLFSCGDNGFVFTEEIESKKAIELLNDAFKYIKENESEKDNQVSYYLMKEFWPEQAESVKKYFEKRNYRELAIDPNMILPIHPDWNDFDDYLASMTTKFRTKAKGAMKKSAEVVLEDFAAEDILKNEHRINTLFTNVVSQSEVNLCELNANAFRQLKEHLGANFRFRVYKLNSEIIGFSASTLLNNKGLEANYVGIDYDYNKEYALYQRMLYDMIDFSIKEQVQTVYFGRTAEELKSTLGAQPTQMKLFVRHRSTLSNQLLKPVVAAVKPKEFELRYPFKAAFTFG